MTTSENLSNPPLTTATIYGKHPTTGKSLAWSSGSWSGDSGLRQAARTLCEAGALLPLGPYGPLVAADATDPLAVTAVIAALTRGRVDGDIPSDRLAELLGADVEDED